MLEKKVRILKSGYSNLVGLVKACRQTKSGKLYKVHFKGFLLGGNHWFKENQIEVIE